MIKSEIKKWAQKLKRDPNGYKYDYGHILVLAGSKQMPGAGVLSCGAALRTGAGLVTFAVKEDFLQSAISLSKPETIFFVYKNSADILEYVLARKVSACVIGPGLELNAETKRLIENIISQLALPVVLDASGISVFKNDFSIFKKAKSKLILTPHEGEFSNLIGIKIAQLSKNAKTIACDFSRENNLILVLKRHKTIAASPTAIYINDTGTPAMATAGSGDVLSGIIAAFVAPKNIADKDLFEAVKFAVWTHGLTGDFAQKEKGNGVIASDLIENIPNVLKKKF